MKILFIGTDTKLFEPGSSVYERFKGFSSLGEEIHMVVARCSKYKEVSKITSNIFVHPTSKKNNLFALIKSFFVAYKILKNDKSERWVISVQDPFENGWIGYFLSKIFKTSFHVQVHTDMLSPFFIKNSFLDRFRVLGSGPILRSADRIRVDALRIKNSIVKKYKIKEDKIDVLHIFIDVPKMTRSGLEIPVEGDYILYVGRFEKEKNIESIIRGFAKSSLKLPNLKLVLLGSGSLENNYKNLGKELGILEKIVFVSWSNNVGDYMKNAKALVLASWFEGFALVLVEAILNDCPIITTDVGAVGGIIPKEYVNIFTQNNTQELSDKIENVVLNYDLEKQKVSELKNIVIGRIPKDLDSYAEIFKESLRKSFN